MFRILLTGSLVVAGVFVAGRDDVRGGVVDAADLASDDDPSLPIPELYEPPLNATPVFDPSPAVPGALPDGVWEPPVIDAIQEQSIVADLSSLVVDGDLSLPDSLIPLGSSPLRAGWGESVVPGVVAGSVDFELLDESTLDGTGFDKVAVLLGADGLAQAAATAGGVLRMAVDYDDFRFAYGGDWAGRLEIVRFDECWLTEAGRAADSGCAEPVAIDADNAYRNGVISFNIPLDVVAPEPEAATARSDGPSGFRSLAAAQSPNGGSGVAVTAAGDSELGSFTATDLTQAAEWSVGLGTGSFQWSYGLPLVPPPAGPVPDPRVLYNSGSIDGLTADENTQGGVMGVGWSLGTDAFIEREYRTCGAEDASTGNDSVVAGLEGNFCYWSPEGDEARYRLSMDGHAGLLMYRNTVNLDRGGTVWEVAKYRLEDDTGLEIFRWRDPSSTSLGGRGFDNDREFFTAADPLGNEYWFGHGTAQGDIFAPAPATTAATSGLSQPDGNLNSVLTHPVIGNTSNEPCFGLNAGNWCHQGYRWNLDRVVDSTDLAMVYLYEQDFNAFNSDLPGDTDGLYSAGSTLNRVFYGSTLADAGKNGAAGLHTGMVQFEYDWRCTNSDGTCAQPQPGADGVLYPDLPVDRFCGPGCTDTDLRTPSFFQRKFLLAMKSYARFGAGAEDWSPYAGLDFTHAFFQAIPEEYPRPFVYKMQRSGFVGDPAGLTLPEIEFQSLATYDNGTDTFYCGPVDPPDDSGYSLPDCGVRPNRVNNWFNGATGVPPMGFMRINRFRDEVGRETRIFYSPLDDSCKNSGGNWNVNRKRCFPGVYEGVFVAFNKFVVDSVVDVDRNDSTTPPITTTYDYLDPAEDATRGGMGWVNTEGTTANSHRDYRGYHEVTVTTGETANLQRITRHRFMRGMQDADVSVDVVMPTGETIADDNHQAGFEFYTARLRADLTEFTRTARKRIVSPLPDYPADSLGRFAARSQLAAEYRLYDGRHSSVAYEYDTSTTATFPTPTLNLLRTIEYGETNADYTNAKGQTRALQSAGFADRNDDRCTVNTYGARNYRFGEGLMSSTTLFGNQNCTGSNPLSKTEFFYDNEPLGSDDALVGQLTKTRRYIGVTSSVYPSATYLDEKVVYEQTQWRRPAESRDARNKLTTYAYSDFTGTQPGNRNTQTATVTEPLAFATTTTFDTFGRVTSTSDINNRATHTCFDRLDRLVDVYLPDVTFATCPENDTPTDAIGSSVHIQYGVDTAPVDFENDVFVGRPEWTVTTSTLWSAPGDSYRLGSETENSYIHNITVLDGFGRTMESATQSPITDNGQANGNPLWLTSRVRYDDVGRLLLDSEPQINPGTQPQFDRTLLNDAAIDRDRRSVYDDVGRTIRTELLNGDGTNVSLIRSQATSYAGYSTTTFPPLNAGDSQAFGETTTTLDAYGNTITVDHAAPGEPIANHVTRYSYDMRFSLLRLTDPLGATTEMTYNDLGWRRYNDHPDNGRSQVTYFRTGEVWQTRDANKQKITNKIDARGRITRTAAGIDPNDNSTLLSKTNYDISGGEQGVVESTTNYQPAGTRVWNQKAIAFDNRGRLTDYSVKVYGANDPTTSADNETDNRFTFTTTHTRSGAVASTTYPAMGGLDSETVQYTYSSIGLHVLAGGPDAIDQYISSSGFDGLARPTYQNVGGGSVWMNKTFGYQFEDARMSAMQATARGSGTNDGEKIATQFYSYDAPGNPTVIYNNVDDNDLDQRECFYYDSRQRLTYAYTKGRANGGGIAQCDPTAPASQDESGPAAYDLDYAYDQDHRFTENANRTLNIYSAESPTSGCRSGTNSTKPHALEQIGAGNNQPAMTFTYDCNGALLTRAETGGDTWTHQWDERQRLTSTQRNTDTTSTNIYDTSGQRAVRIDPNGDRTIYYGASELRFDKSAGTVTAARYYPGGSIRTFDNGDNNLTYTATNHQHSIIVSLDQNTGTWNHTRYEPYGTIRDGNPTADKAFLNQTRDQDQQLTYLNNRHYNPQLGAFLSVDPLVTATMQPYIYGAANPVTFSDPEGLEPRPIHNPNYDPATAGPDPYASGCGGYGCASPVAAPPPRPTAFDDFTDELWSIWDSSEHFSDFNDRAALAIAGVDIGSLPFPGSFRIPFLDPTRTTEQVLTNILGESGWRLGLTDGDQRPARHFYAVFSVAWANGTWAATFALEDNEAAGNQGSSLQDLNSGYAAILLANRYTGFNTPVTDEQFAAFISGLQAIAGDPYRIASCCDVVFDQTRIPVSQRPGDGGVIMDQQGRFLSWPP